MNHVHNADVVNSEILASAQRTIDTLGRELVEAQMQLHQQMQSTEPQRLELASIKLKLQRAEQTAKEWEQKADKFEREYRHAIVERDSAQQLLKESKGIAAGVDTARLKELELLMHRVAELEITVQIERAKNATAMTMREGVGGSGNSSTSSIEGVIDAATSKVAERTSNSGHGMTTTGLTFGGGVEPSFSSSSSAPAFSFGAAGAGATATATAARGSSASAGIGSAQTNTAQQLFILQTENDSLKLSRRTMEAKNEQLLRANQQLTRTNQEQLDQIRRMTYRQHDIVVAPAAASAPVANPNNSNNSSPSRSVALTTRFDVQEHEKLRMEHARAKEELRRVSGQLADLQRIHSLSTSHATSQQMTLARMMADNAGLEQQLMQSRHSRDLLSMHVDAILKKPTTTTAQLQLSATAKPMSTTTAVASILDRDTSSLRIAKEFESAFQIMSLEHFSAVARVEQEQLRLMNSLLQDRAHLLEHQLAVSAAERMSMEKEIKALMRKEATSLYGAESVSPAAEQQQRRASSPASRPALTLATSTTTTTSIAAAAAAAAAASNNSDHDLPGWKPLPLLVAHEQIRSQLEKQVQKLQADTTRANIVAENIGRTANTRVANVLDIGRFHLLESSRLMKEEMLAAAAHALRYRGAADNGADKQRKLDEAEAKWRQQQDEIETLRSAVVEKELQIGNARRVSDDLSRATIAGAASAMSQLQNALASAASTLTQHVGQSLYFYFSEQSFAALSTLLDDASNGNNNSKLAKCVSQLAAVQIGGGAARATSTAADITPIFESLHEAIYVDLSRVQELNHAVISGLSDAIARAELEHGEMRARNVLAQMRMDGLVIATARRAAMNPAFAAHSLSSPSDWMPSSSQLGLDSPQQQQQQQHTPSRDAGEPTFAGRRAAGTAAAPVSTLSGTPASQLLRNAAAASHKPASSASSSSAAAAAAAGATAATPSHIVGGVTMRQFNTLSQVTLISFSAALLQQKRDLGKHFMDLLADAASSTTRIKRDSTYALDIVPMRRERDAALAELASANRAALDLVDARKEYDARLKELAASLDNERVLKELERERVKNLQMEAYSHKERALRMEGEATDLRFALHQQHKNDSANESVVVASLSEQQRSLMQRAQELERQKMTVELALADATGEIRTARRAAREAEDAKSAAEETLRRCQVEMQIRAEKTEQLRAEGAEAAMVVETLKMHLHQEQMKLEQATRQGDEWRVKASELMRRIEVDENLLKQIVGGSSPSWLSQQRSAGAGGGINDSAGSFGTGFFAQDDRHYHQQHSGGGAAAGAGGRSGGELRELPGVELAAVKNAQRAVIDSTLERSRLEARIDAAKKEGVNSVAELRRAWDVKNNALDLRELQLNEQHSRLDAFCAAVVERMSMATNSERHHRLRSETLAHVNDELRKIAGMFVRRIKRQTLHLRGWESAQMQRHDRRAGQNDVGTQTNQRDDNFSDLLLKKAAAAAAAAGHNSQLMGDGKRHAAQGGRAFFQLVFESLAQLHDQHVFAGYTAAALLLALVTSFCSFVSGVWYGTSKCVVC